MAIIQLQKGRGEALIDERDLAFLSQFKWYLHSAYRAKKSGGKQTNYLMHREIMQPEGSLVVDHINGNRLDNRRENLRSVTHAHNSQNTCAINKTSKYKGVSFHTSKGKWRATIKQGGKARHIGYFESQEAAAEAYKAESINRFGEFAKLNNSEAVSHG